MNRIVLIVCWLVSISCLSRSQTEVYRLSDSPIWQVLQDGHGNAYMLYGIGHQSVKKIGPSGSVLWNTTINSLASYAITYSGSGLYATPMAVYSVPGYDTVWYYDTSGAISWHSHVPAGVALFTVVADAQGNLIVFGDSAGTSKLMKIDRAGNLLFDVALPLSISIGPMINSDGNIWLIADYGRDTTYTLCGNTEQQQFYSEDVLLLDGNSGALILQKRLFENLSSIRDNCRGFRKEVEYFPNLLGDPIAYKVYKSNLVYAGTWSTVTTTINKRRNTRDEKSEWRMMIVSPAGKITTVRYKGKGLATGVDAVGRYRSDFGYNDFVNFAISNDDAIYLHGSVARGRAINDPSKLHADDLIFRYDAIRRRIDWKLTAPDQGLNMFFYSPAQKLFVGPYETTTLKVYDKTGAVGSSQLSFADKVVLDERGENLESGYFYTKMWHDEPGNQYYYYAKYFLGASLADKGFTTHVALNGDGNASAFSLLQNYPNPFNPSTTIEFELATEALVTAKVYNILGQEVVTLVNREQFSEGVNELEFDGSNLPSGVYYYRITAEDITGKGILHTSVRKMILAK